MQLLDRTIQTPRQLPSRHRAGKMLRTNEPPAAHELHFQHLIGILSRRRRLIVVTAAAGTMLAAMAGLLIAPKYTAKAQIEVEAASAGPGAGQTAVASSADQSAIDTQVTMLMSHEHLQRVLNSLREGQEPGNVAPGAKPEPEEVAAPGGNTLSSSAAGGADPLATEVETLSLNELKRRLGIWIGGLARRRAATVLSIEELERNLRVYQERTSRIIAVSFTSTNPARAAAITNRTVQLYVERHYDRKKEALRRELARLDGRIAELAIATANAGANVETAIQQRAGSPQGSGARARDDQERLQQSLREVTANGQLQDSLLRRQREIRSEQEIFVPDVRIVSFAWAPNRPSSPNPALFIFPALIICSICGAFLAVGMEQFDRGLRSERDISDALGIPCIGLVPQVRRPHGIQLYQYPLRRPLAAYSEAIRSVLAAMQAPTNRLAPKVILICSSIKGEGKTTFAMSLAVCAARLGKRVLVADLDFRHPSATDERDGKRGTFNRNSLDLLVTGAAPAESIEHIPDLNIDRLAIGHCAIDPLTPFANDRLPCLLYQLRDTYDLVIVDSSPLICVAETRLLAPLVDKVLFLVRWARTRREVAQQGLNLLLNTGAFDDGRQDLPSAVVTQVNLKEHARYRYGDVGEFLAKL